jgi:hypothetical protein
MKIVINKCYGGFGLSNEAVEEYLKLKGLEYTKKDSEWSFMQGDKSYYVNGEYVSDRDFLRDDPVLIEVVEKLGDVAYGQFSELKIVEIPDDVKWQIEEYDGIEWIAEQHNTWG